MPIKYQYCIECGRDVFSHVLSTGKVFHVNYQVIDLKRIGKHNATYGIQPDTCYGPFAASAPPELETDWQEHLPLPPLEEILVDNITSFPPHMQ